MYFLIEIVFSKADTEWRNNSRLQKTILFLIKSYFLIVFVYFDS